METNIFVKIPMRGDIVVKDFETKTPQYISLASFSKADLDESSYEVVGVVYYREGNQIGVVYKENAGSTWCDRYSYKLTGYTLDGTDRTGVISFRENSSASANTDITISYNATTTEDLCTQLNAAFQANSAMKSQDWYAEVVDDYISIHYTYTFWQQSSYNTGKSGFTLSANLLPEVISLANIRRKHGGKGAEGVISNWYRALAYFRNDNSSTTYNPNSDVTSIKRTYPVCLPAYLGTSTYQSDHCALLRQTYGDGEDGWLKFMMSCLPVIPTDYGNMGQHDGKARTAILASKTYNSTIKTNEPLCKAAKYCYDKSSDTVDAGEFWLPTTEEVFRILDGVQYGTNSSRDADVLNEALNKIGGSAISNGSNLWSCCRYLSGSAWDAFGYYGFFYSNGMCYSCSCVPVSLYEIE